MNTRNKKISRSFQNWLLLLVAAAFLTVNRIEDDLESVSGGAALTGQTVGFGTTCEHFICCFCGCGKSDPQETKHTCAPLWW